MDKRQLLKTFISIYFELLNNIKKHSDNHDEFDSFYKKNYMLKKTNIKMFIRMWYDNITLEYYDKIMKGNIEYMFSGELIDNISSKTNGNIIQYMNIIKNKYKNTDKCIVNNYLLKIQQLTQISSLYFNSK